MVRRALLTPDYVDELRPPPDGEVWIADAALRGFGIRLWAGKGGGGLTYAIRARDISGRLVRKSFSVWADDGDLWFARAKAIELIEGGELSPPLGVFLDEAREWARDRLNVLRGRRTRAERRHLRYQQASALVQSYTLEQMANMAFQKLKRSGRKEEYIIQLVKLFGVISPSLRNSRLARINIKVLAAEIASDELPFGQSKALQAFIGQLFARAQRWDGSIGRVSNLLTRAIHNVRHKRRTPPFPKIQRISDQEMKDFLRRLEAEELYWRQALAIRFYFETSAKMRRVLSARWDEIVDGVWYPYIPTERRHWYLGREPLSAGAMRILDLAASHLSQETGLSEFVFPRRDAPGPIATVHRFWIRVAREFGWDGLPLSHVVLRYKDRNTPSYIYMCYYLYAPFERKLIEDGIVSKLGKLSSKNVALT